MRARVGDGLEVEMENGEGVELFRLFAYFGTMAYMTIAKIASIARREIIRMVRDWFIY